MFAARRLICAWLLLHFIVVNRGVAAAKRRYFDNFRAKTHMHDFETAAYDTTIAKQLADLLGMRVGGDIEIFGMAAEQQIPHAATYQIGLKTTCAQSGNNF